ncbi:vacuolar protein sorting 55 [Polychytrium aggregatum]|uniref:vacuolar protein sorting 55 n=1 Tax=Polychytrium aggregatum TaxID=110093 RepID=UPI0022FF09B9|nr:vacuolar protein sorting 55 [Polychytrium aggregatum]KAI9204202.1 vacuolar protein sorting 55 [Polychytrium aggregatum]
MAGMKTIIGLAFLLACGTLLVILSCALYSNWLPLLVVLTYALAPIPNMICKRIGGGDFMTGENRGVLETGYFITSFLIVSGFGIPFVLAHAGKITVPAMILSFSGGLIVYATILGYVHFFVTVDEPF